MYYCFRLDRIQSRNTEEAKRKRKRKRKVMCKVMCKVIKQKNLTQTARLNGTGVKRNALLATSIPYHADMDRKHGLVQHGLIKH